MTFKTGPLLSFILLVLTAFCSCGSSERGIGYSCTALSTGTGRVMEWPATAFVFDGSSCKEVQTVGKASDLERLKASSGNDVVVVACERTDGIGFTQTRPGKDRDLYSLLTEDGSAICPELWYGKSTVRNGVKTVSQELMPLTAELVMKYSDAPWDFKSMTISIDGCAESYKPGHDAFASGSSPVPMTAVLNACDASSGEAEVFFLPVLDPGSKFEPDVTIDVGGVILKPEMTLPSGPDRGASLTVSVDFKNLKSAKTYRMTVSEVDIVTGAVIYSRSETFSAASVAVDEGDVKCEVFRDGRWTSVSVRQALCSDASKHSLIWNDWDNSAALRDTMSYCIIEDALDAPLKVRLHRDRPFSNVVVRPSSYGIEPSLSGGNTVEFTIPSRNCRKVSVEFDGNRQNNLFIYADSPDTDRPSESSPAVIYFGPGVHRPGTVRLSAGQTLYIDYGAVVYANVVAKGNDITIAGHGVLSGAEMTHTGDNLYSWGDFLIRCNPDNAQMKNLTIKDLTLIDGPGWNICVSSAENVRINNVNIISWELNGDGIDIVSCRDVEIDGCFIRTYDDCITLKCRFIVNPITDVSQVKIKNCLIWADYARGIVVGPESGNAGTSAGRIHDVEVSDCIFLQHARGLSDDLRSAFAIGQGSDGQTDLWRGSNPPTMISDVTASNLFFDNIDKTGRALSFRQYASDGSVCMKRIRLSGIKVINNGINNYPALEINTNGSVIEGLEIEDFTVNGAKILSAGSQLRIDRPAQVDCTIK